MKNKKFKFMSICLTFCILCSSVLFVTADNTVYSTDTLEDVVGIEDNGYESYRASAEEWEYGTEQLLNIQNITAKSDNSEISENINSADKNGVIIPDNGYATWQFKCDKDSSYVIEVSYMAAEKSSGNIELALLIDGEIPFSEVSIVSFERTYEQEAGEFATNAAGNHLKPEVNEIFIWKQKQISDSSGYITEPFIFNFKEGTHTVSLYGSRGSIAVNSIALIPYEKPISYEEYLFNCKEQGYKEAKGKITEIEAEYMVYKSAVTILPDTDRSSAGTTPQSASALLLNTMGGDNWKSIGNSATWKFSVENTGMYEISTRFLQNTKDGIFTCRKLYIDGKLPFAEAADLRFDYDSDWQCEKLGSGNETFKFYLEEGEHTLTLEVTAGDVADIINTVSSSIDDLNRINRRIKLITGNNVDTNRDYKFKELIPDEIAEMAEICKELQASVDYINEQAGANGSFVSVIQKIIFQLEKMSENPRDIAKYLERFRSNLGSLGEWLLSATEQPLKLDKIYIQPAGSETPAAKPSFFKSLAFSVKSFIFSYATDYSTIGAESNDEKTETLTVWVQTGRDQGQIIRELVDESFAEEHNASVKLQVVIGGLLQSVLAGISPDIVCDCAETVPMEYALRNAVTDLTQFSDYEEIFSRFSKASIKPASFDGAVYGMPQTFTNFMMFYRTDIFSEYGYSVPTTWTELCEMIPSLQRNGMEVGIPHTLEMYTTFLYQNGGELYINSGESNNLSAYTSVVSFADLTEFFTLYNCPVTYNFANRFRSGEIPIAIAPYTEYNQLTAFAPEIKGNWKMVPIPGVEQADGSVNNVSVGTGTYLVMMNKSEKKELAWEFMKWFMSAEVQSSYAVQMESILGTCAKVASANVEALSDMTWSSSEYTELFSQLESVDAVPQVPGGYYLSRIITFAFNRVYNNDENPKEVLSDYIKELNEELTRKRVEFGLESEADEG